MRRFGLGDRWAFYALHDDRRYFGMSERSCKRLTDRRADQPPRRHRAAPELRHRPARVPGDRSGAAQVELHHNVQATLDFLEPHCAFFTFAENYGNPDCGLPVAGPVPVPPHAQPVVIDLWSGPAAAGEPLHHGRQLAPAVARHHFDGEATAGASTTSS